MVTLKIYLRIHGKTSDSGVVYISFYVNREKVNFSTSVRCEVNDWNGDKSCIKKSDKNADDKNRLIENIRARINDVFVKYRLKNKKLTRDSFLRAYNRPDDFSTFFDFIKANARNINYGNELTTINTHNVVIKKVKEWQPDLHFDDITEDWLHRYYIYLRKDCGNNDNTTGKNMTTFKKYILAAWKMGYMDENPFVN